MLEFHRRPSLSSLLPLGAFAATALLAGCGSNPTTSTGGADISMHALGALDVQNVVATVSGPALPAPKSVALSARGSSGTWGALIGSLPVGSNYVFSVSASDHANAPDYAGSVAGIAILKDQVTSVIITAQQTAASVPFKNAVPVIDSLVLSSTNIVPGATITAKATAHDPNVGDTIAFAWSASPTTGGFATASAATTTWTAPASEGDRTLTLQVTDNHGASTSTSVIVHVSASNGRGQADVNVRFNTWPVVTDLVAAPGYIVAGAPTSLTVTANDADGDALSYTWTSTCTSGVFSIATTTATSFTLPTGATDTSCDLTVTVSDGKGGVTSGQTTLPVGAAVAVQAPVVTDSVQSVSVVDVGGSVNFAIDASDPQGSPLTFTWVATSGVLADQSNGVSSSQIVWTAPASEKASFTVSVIVTNALGGSVQYDFAVSTAALASTCAPPASTAWSFGVMSDTQWTGSPDDGRDPNTVTVDIINQLNAQFIAKGVKFVVQVGDLTDNGSNLALQTTALFRQKLYNAGIGFFPLRGNHESSLAGAAEFKRVFPQTQTGTMNATPADVFGLMGSVDDAFTNPVTAAGGVFTTGSNFSSPSAGTLGLSYAFDYGNARLVLLDQFVSFDGTASASGGNYLDPQLPWIASALAGKPAGGHAFVFGHKGLITENHVDTLFGANPSVDPTGQDTFIKALAGNGVRYYFGGHDHMHNRSLIATTDGVTAKVQDIIGASDSSKFYIPANPSNDQKYDVPAFGHTRQTQIAQELNTVGYYVFTVDGSRVSVDFYSAIVNPTLSSGEYLISASVPLAFSKRETFGYGLTGQESVVPEGASYTGSLGSFAGTTASILAGTNTSNAKDASTRPLNHLLDSAWEAPTCATAGAILSLWGTADLGSASGDTAVLSMSFDRASVSDATLLGGSFGLATQDSAGNWTNAVAQNVGGSPTFVLGAWNASYQLGTFGVDPATSTAWAVLNHAGRFAIARF